MRRRSPVSVARSDRRGSGLAFWVFRSGVKPGGQPITANGDIASDRRSAWGRAAQRGRGRGRSGGEPGRRAWSSPALSGTPAV